VPVAAEAFHTVVEVIGDVQASVGADGHVGRTLKLTVG
jgi:hypothetical protein